MLSKKEIKSFDFKDVHNKNLLLMTHHSSFVPPTSDLFDGNSALLLHRGDPHHFHSCCVYIPMKTLLQNGIERHVEGICDDMERHLDRKRRGWDNALFLDFTHVLIRNTWFGETFDNKELLKRYTVLANRFLDSYVLHYGIFDTFKGMSKTKLRRLKRGFISKLDLGMQFLHILGHEFEDEVRRQVIKLFGMRHTKQIEHLYMLMHANAQELFKN